MKAMILAAGLGSRLRPITEGLPKALLPLDGRPLVQYTLLLLKKYGIRDVIINLHHQGQKIVEALGSGSGWGLSITYSHEREILGTGGALKKVSRLLSDGPFLVINGDILVDINIDKVVGFHRRKKAIATMVLREDKDADAWGAVEIDSREQVRQIRGRLPCEKRGLLKRMFTGIHVMEPGVLEQIPSTGYSNILDAYVAMIRKGERVMGYTMRGYWMDLGTPERYRKALEDLQRGGVTFGYLKRG